VRRISESTALFLSKEYKKSPGKHHRAIFYYGGRRLVGRVFFLPPFALLEQRKVTK
jgi:hypothetical protein